MHHSIHQFILLSSILFGNFLSSETYFVNNKDQYYKVTKNLNAGDTVVLENGIWNDFEILFEGQGTENEFLYPYYKNLFYITLNYFHNIGHKN